MYSEDSRRVAHRFTGDTRPSLSAVGSFFNSIPGMYLILDPDLRVIDVTDAYLSATRAERSEIVGRDFLDVFPDDAYTAGAAGVSDLRSSLERAVQSLKPNSMAVLTQGSRRLRPVNTPVVGPDGKLAHIVHQLEDTSLEESLEVNAKLRASSEAKNVFIGRMSHELRSPLTAVIGYSELLKLDAPLGDEDRQAVEAIFRAGQHLMNLTNDVLDITGIEAGHTPMSIERVRVQSVLESSIELVTPFAQSMGITIDLPDEPNNLYVKADFRRLTQVVVNLLSNAIKYNRPSGRVLIAATMLPNSGSVRLAVTDTGMGIAECDLTKLFQAFERLGAEAGEIEGTGLGLSLTRSLVEGMGGLIDVHSEVGIGTTFTVELATDEPRRS